MNENSNDFEILTLEEFCLRMKIGRSTVITWKNKGILKLGIHYVQIERVVRYFWSENTIANLQQQLTTSDDVTSKAIKKEKKERQDQDNVKQHRNNLNRTKINLEY